MLWPLLLILYINDVFFYCWWSSIYHISRCYERIFTGTKPDIIRTAANPILSSFKEWNNLKRWTINASNASITFRTSKCTAKYIGWPMLKWCQNPHFKWNEVACHFFELHVLKLPYLLIQGKLSRINDVMNSYKVTLHRGVKIMFLHRTFCVNN